MLHIRLALFLSLLLLVNSCTEQDPSGGLTYSTSTDVARRHYDIGWQQIMDQGHYGASEISYRKALSADPDFLIGKAVLARLTLDLDERLRLFHEIQKDKHLIKGDERLILDVYNGLTHFTNVRAKHPERAKATIDSVLVLSENNLRHIIHRYPGEIYLKCEYLEILHSNYGAQAALDSLYHICSPQQLDNHFLLGFAASLLAEVGQYNDAISKAQRLKLLIDDHTIPKSHAVFADIYYEMDSLTLAKGNADRAVGLDPRNLDASRLQKKINDKISMRQ